MNRESLIIEYYPMVQEIASRISQRLPTHIETEDLLHIGMIGLIDALDRLKESNPATLKAYLKIRIQGAILDELRRNDWIPRSVRERHSRLNRTKNILQEKLDRAPSDSEMAKALNIPLERYDRFKCLSEISTVLSMDSKEDGHLSIAEILPSREMTVLEQIESFENKKIITTALQNLSDRDNQIIELYYYKEFTFRQISEILGVTEARISQLHTQIRNKLQKDPNIKQLK
jgi:RNA polymerase sigma factor FliA